MLDAVLKILLAVFAVFGLYAFSLFLGAVCFRNDKIRLAVWIDSWEIVGQIDLYLDEAKDASLFLGKTNVFAIVMEKYATDELMQILKRKKIPYEIVSRETDGNGFSS